MSPIISLTELFEDLGRETSESIAQFSSHKEDLCREVFRLSRENDNLLGRNIGKSSQIQSENINLPQDMNEIHFFLLKLQEDFITTLVAKERLEETSRNDKTFLQSKSPVSQLQTNRINLSFSHSCQHFLPTDQLKTEVQSRDSLIHELTVERDQYRKEAKKLRHDFEKQACQLKEQEEILEQCQERIAKIMVDNDTTVTDLKWKLEDLTRNNLALEDETSSLRNKVQSLQVELDNSEVVQRDFVKLSQSLQIQLEKIRQADSEVRWQHEDDVTECNQCGKKVNSRKEKVRLCIWRPCVSTSNLCFCRL